MSARLSAIGPANLQPTRLEQATQLPSFYAEDSVTAANETWARLHADPLFAMKQQELAARKRIIKNPVLMAAVRQEVCLDFAKCLKVLSARRSRAQDSPWHLRKLLCVGVGVMRVILRSLYLRRLNPSRPRKPPRRRRRRRRRRRKRTRRHLRSRRSATSRTRRRTWQWWRPARRPSGTGRPGAAP